MPNCYSITARYVRFTPCLNHDELMYLKTYIDQIMSEEGSQSHSSCAGAAPLTNKLSGKFPRGRRKSRQPPSGPEPRTRSYSSLTKLAVPVSSVSAFCQAVLSKIIPHEFWGIGDVQNQNFETFLRNVDCFIKLRRFETSSLHEVIQGMKVRVPPLPRYAPFGRLRG